MAVSPERRRLNTLLTDPEYGAMLARLNRSEEREILDLISDNRGREARKRLRELDTSRRQGGRVKKKVRAYLDLAPEDRKGEAWKALSKQELSDIRLFWKLYKEQESGKSPMDTPQQPPTPARHGDKLERKIRRVYEALASAPGENVKLARLRPYFPDVDRAVMDAKLREMNAEPDVYLRADSDQRRLTEEDRRAAITIGGSDRHLIMIDTD